MSEQRTPYTVDGDMTWEWKPGGALALAVAQHNMMQAWEAWDRRRQRDVAVRRAEAEAADVDALLRNAGA